VRKIRKGDNVVVISGRDKGRKGAVLAVLENDTCSSRTSIGSSVTRAATRR